MQVATRTSVVRDVVSESFSLNDFDGYWYPAQRERSLVRIYVTDSGYQIERRRKLDSAWMPVATARTEDFDPDAFCAWKSNWRLVA
jgi:hypothetical protein